jgi:uncharacterized protein (UPF0333 family)
MQILKNRKGQTDSVFKLALVVIIIAAVLAVVSYLMGSAWSGTEDIATGAVTASETVADSTDCLVTGTCAEGGLGS